MAYRSLPLDGKEMLAFLSYLRWINMNLPDSVAGTHNLDITFMDRAANPVKGKELFVQHCQRCHAANGQGIWKTDSSGYMYPPLWGSYGYQPGSSMHRIIMQARWLKANMPYGLATWAKPVLTDNACMDIAAFVNDDRIHQRPSPANFDFPDPKEKPIDYGKGPFADPFNAMQHKFGPYPPIIAWRNNNGMKAKV